MLPNGRSLGVHLPLGPGMIRAADRAAEIGVSALQVFTDNPTAWRRRDTLPADLPAFRDRLTAHAITPLVIHAPYLVNLAGPDQTVFERSVAVMVNELQVAAAYGAAMVNVHIGSHRGDGVEAGINRVAAGLREVYDRVGGGASDVVLVLENGSGGGFGLGSTIEELGAIDDALGAAGIPADRTGFCLDTAHLWGAGYAIDSADGVDEMLAAFGAHVGLDRLRLVHLNDSRSEGGSRGDRHEHLGAGRIGAAGLRRILDHPALGRVTYMLETPGTEQGYDAVNVARAYDLVAGRPLADLPPEAFEMRSARGTAAPPGTAPDEGPRRGGSGRRSSSEAPAT